MYQLGRVKRYEEGCVSHAPGECSVEDRDAPLDLRVEHTRQYRAECMSCGGLGHNETRARFHSTMWPTCRGCDGRGWIMVTETWYE